MAAVLGKRFSPLTLVVHLTVLGAKNLATKSCGAH